MRIFRLIKILRVALRFGLDEFLLGHERVRTLRIALSSDPGAMKLLDQIATEK